MASDARDRAAAYTEASGKLADAATRPLASWQALQEAMTSAGTDGVAALDAATAAADGTESAFEDAGAAASGAGSAGKVAAGGNRLDGGHGGFWQTMPAKPAISVQMLVSRWSEHSSAPRMRWPTSSKPAS